MGEFKRRIIDPLLIPLGAAVFIGILVLSVSRILLAVPEVGATGAALIISAEILGVAGVLAAGRGTKPVQRALLVLVGLGLIGGGVASAELGVRHVESAVGVEVALSAKNTKFSQDALTIPPDTKAVIKFTNDDVGTPHNVALFIDPGHSNAIFHGTIITGPASIAYAVAPLKPGTYFFHCDVHPQMQGKLVAGKAGTVPPGGPPQPIASGPPPPVAGTPSGSVTVTANGLKFDTTQIVLFANKQVSITLDNKDANISHNLAIYTQPDGQGQRLFGQTPFPGVATQTWKFQAPKPGTYYFRCDVHFDMKGTAIFK
jgi:plastocyanin